MQDARGVSDFEALQAALRSQPTRLIFYAFDLLHLDGKDLRDIPLVERRAKLQTLLGSLESPLQFSEEFIGDADAFFRAWMKPVITLKVKHLAFGSGLLRHATANLTQSEEAA